MQYFSPEDVFVLQFWSARFKRKGEVRGGTADFIRLQRSSSVPVQNGSCEASSSHCVEL